MNSKWCKCSFWSCFGCLLCFVVPVFLALDFLYAVMHQYYPFSVCDTYILLFMCLQEWSLRTVFYCCTKCIRDLCMLWFKFVLWPLVCLCACWLFFEGYKECAEERGCDFTHVGSVCVWGGEVGRDEASIQCVCMWWHSFINVFCVNPAILIIFLLLCWQDSMYSFVGGAS
jgi:hypothetical protein